MPVLEVQAESNRKKLFAESVFCRLLRKAPPYDCHRRLKILPDTLFLRKGEDTCESSEKGKKNEERQCVYGLVS